MSAVVKDVMSTHPVSVTRDASFKELAARLFELGVSGFPVVDDDGKVIGVVSEADMLAKEAREYGYHGWRGMAAAMAHRTERRKADGVSAGDLMTSPAVTVAAEDTVERAASLMYDRKLKRLPVVDAAGKLLGIISRVVVVRGHWRPVNQSPGPVVAGVDGSPASQDALRFAFEEAALRDVPLVAVCALADAPGKFAGAARRGEGFSRLMTSHEKEHPEVTVLRQVTFGSPRSALLAAAAEAQLLVLGSRGLGGLEGMSLGSVAGALVHHSPCPAAVVHLAAR